MAANRTVRRSRGWRHLGRFVVAHAVAVASGSVVLAVTAIVLAIADRAAPGSAATGPALSPLMMVGGALVMALLSIVVGAIVALPASVMAYPLALLAVRRGVRGGRLLALGAAAGLVAGLPLLIVTLSAGDLPRLWAELPGTMRDAAGSFGPAAAAAGAGFAWIVGRTRG